jgi:hypothetical protein
MSQQRQLETIEDSKAAVERALERRGLADRFQLVVTLNQTEIHISSYFSIQEKVLT